MSIEYKVNLISAITKNQIDLVKFLLEEGGKDPNEFSEEGLSPLALACKLGFAEIVAFLIEKGANVHSKNISSPEWTPLHTATFYEHGKIVLILIEQGADPCALDERGCSSVDYASISEAIWPLFAFKGYVKVEKDELITKGIIRKRRRDSGTEIKNLSRPGCSYTLVAEEEVREKNKDEINKKKNNNKIVDDDSEGIEDRKYSYTLQDLGLGK